MENKVLGPLLKERLEQAFSEGFEQGRKEVRLLVISDLLAKKFGTIPGWANEKLQRASLAESESWIIQALQSDTIEEALR